MNHSTSKPTQRMQSDAQKPEYPSEVIAKNMHKSKQPLTSHVFYTVQWETISDASQCTVTYLVDWLMQRERVLHEFCLELIIFFILYANFSFFFIWVLFLPCSCSHNILWYCKAKQPYLRWRLGTSACDQINVIVLPQTWLTAGTYARSLSVRTCSHYNTWTKNTQKRSLHHMCLGQVLGMHKSWVHW